MLMRILYHYYRTIFLKKHIHSREQLIAHQNRQFQTLARQHLPRSPYYKQYIGKPLNEWPVSNKQIMMDHFDEINTVGIKKERALAVALNAETSRDFSPLINNISVGLSSGTSGKRGLFLASPRERDAWAGIMLANLLPHGFRTQERIALFLRSNNQLYTTLNKSRKIQFHFFDLLADFDQVFPALNKINPTILAAPASVLLALAKQKHRLTIRPTKLLAVAEVLEKQDEDFISHAFQQQISQIYQCTEGFLAISDKYNNRLMMNEMYLIIEKERIDDTRFVPIITDLMRRTQPIIRYRLDDVLIEKKPTGVFTELLGIEGRLGDVCYGKKGVLTVPIFADTIRQHIAGCPLVIEDYDIQQEALNAFSIQIDSELTNRDLFITHLNQLFKQKGCEIPHWQWHPYKKREMEFKRRRIRGFK